MDNLSAHKGERVRRLIEDGRCEVPYLPLYALNPNPLEAAFSTVERVLRVIGAQTKEALVEAIGKALER